MFIVTNRQVFEDRVNLEAFGPKPNPEGPNELRLAEARKVGRSWRVNILPDTVTPAMAAEVDLTLPPAPPGGTAPPVYASRYVARRLMARVDPKFVGQTGPGRNLVLFVHGFNNDLQAVLERGAQFERDYGVEVLLFSWPANGGGARGVVSYLSDKRDARVSVGALDRVFAKLQEFLVEIHAEHEARVTALAEKKFPHDADKWDEFYTAQAHQWCPFHLNLVCHSMGNYLFKNLLGSSVYRATSLIFDNVLLVAADTNSEDHDDWVERIPARRRVFITLNEHDFALRASCLKMGEAQKARLGHYLFDLAAKNATYVNFTGAPHVGVSHGYFEGEPLKNPQVKTFFHAAFNGEAAETALTYNAARNTYELDAPPPRRPAARAAPAPPAAGPDRPYPNSGYPARPVPPAAAGNLPVAFLRPLVPLPSHAGPRNHLQGMAPPNDPHGPHAPRVRPLVLLRRLHRLARRGPPPRRARAHHRRTRRPR